MVELAGSRNGISPHHRLCHQLHRKGEKTLIILNERFCAHQFSGQPEWINSLEINAVHIIYTKQVFSGLLHHYQTLRWHFGDDSNQCDECNHLALVHSLQSAKASLSCPLTSQTFVLEIFIQQWFAIFYNFKAYRCASRQLRSFFVNICLISACIAVAFALALFAGGLFKISF